MTEIHLPAAELRPVLAGLAKVASKRPTLPVLGCVQLSCTAAGQVELTATDLNSSAVACIPSATASETAAVLVPISDLREVANRSELAENITIHVTDSSTVVLRYKVGGHQVEKCCASFPVEEFPPVSSINGDVAVLDDAVRQAILDAQQCASSDETRLILNGAFIDVTRPDAHYIVGTDGRHLFSANSFKLQIDNSLVLPVHPFLRSKPFNSDGAWRLRVGAPDNDDAPLFEVATDHWRFVSRSLAGNYPNWRQVVPNGSSTKTRVAVDENALGKLIDTIERLPDTDAVNHGIGLAFSRRATTLLVRAAADAPRTSVPLDGAETQGSSVTLFVNRNLLTKALRFGLTQLDIIDEMSPLRFWNGGRQMIVMPIRADIGPAHHQTFRPTGASAPRADTNPPPETADNPKEDTTMPETNGTTTNGRPRVAANCNAEADATTPLEAAFAQIETIKGSYREAIRGLNGLADLLKQASREQKNHEKEISSVRQTLRQIQAVRI